jgi:hypothetical protein
MNDDGAQVTLCEMMSSQLWVPLLYRKNEFLIATLLGLLLSATEIGFRHGRASRLAAICRDFRAPLRSDSDQRSEDALRKLSPNQRAENPSPVT